MHHDAIAAAVEDRAVPGHWEGDLLAGSHNTHIATRVERQSRFTMLVKVNGKDTDRREGSQQAGMSSACRAAKVADLGPWVGDGGAQGVLGRHGRPGLLLRPAEPVATRNEREHGRLLRQYFPKGTDLSVCSQADLNRTALRLNQRPRKTLDFRTPADVLNESVALTG